MIVGGGSSQRNAEKMLSAVVQKQLLHIVLRRTVAPVRVEAVAPARVAAEVLREVVVEVWAVLLAAHREEPKAATVASLPHPHQRRHHPLLHPHLLPHLRAVPLVPCGRVLSVR